MIQNYENPLSSPIMPQDNSDREITNTRIFQHSRERIFAAFADPDQLARWWGPNGFTNTFHDFDFRSGGKWNLTMHGPDGQDYKNECFFRELSPPGKIIIDHISAPRFELEVTLENAKGGTLLTWVQRFESQEMRDRVLSIVGPANEENLDRMTKVIEQS
jgi:uncharacterized protein YndB with AHSA1/START domain